MKAENYIFTQDKTKIVKQESSSKECYCLLGDHDFIDINNKPRTNIENKSTLAKCVADDSGKRFYIKTGTSGKI